MSTDSTSGIHPLAPHHLPSFISDASGYDPMITNVSIFILVMVFLLLTFFLHLHSLPEKLAHEVGANQLQIVGVLTLIALFSHNNLFWVAALLLALVKIPDYQTPLDRIAGAMEGLRAAQPPAPASATSAPSTPSAAPAVAEPHPPAAPTQTADTYQPSDTKNAEA